MAALVLSTNEDFAPFPFGDPKLVQGRPQVAEEDLPIARADPHPFVGSRHIPTGIVEGTSGTRAEKIDQQLLLPADAVRSPVRPKATQLRIRHQAGKKVISNRRNRIVTAETSVQGRCSLFGHERLLSPSRRSCPLRYRKAFQSLSTGATIAKHARTPTGEIGSASRLPDQGRERARHFGTEPGPCQLPSPSSRSLGAAVAEEIREGVQ